MVNYMIDPTVPKKRFRRRSINRYDLGSLNDGPMDCDIKAVEEIHPEGMEIAREAMELIIKQRLYDLATEKKKRTGHNRPSPLASDHVQERLGFTDPEWNGSPEWHKILTVAMDLARTDPRYWGVRDPTKERYCSLCRKVHPIEEFEGDKLRCPASLAKRRKWSSYAKV